MASPATEHGGFDPTPDGSARSNACRHGADPGHPEPRQGGASRQERAEHGDGAEAARPFPCSGRSAASAAEESAGLAFEEASSGMMRDSRRRAPAPSAAADVVAAFLGFLADDIAGAPRRIKPLAAARIKKARHLTRRVRVHDDETLPDDVTL